MKNQNTWETYTEEQIRDCDAFCRDYMDFLSEGKTERECVERIEKDLKAAGYHTLQSYIEAGRCPAVGDRIYQVYMKKSVIMFQVGQDPLEKGMNILGAHIDSPRLDVKQNPLYEEGGFAYLDTHYYGGIKKWQWVTIPLALHGVILKRDGTVVTVNVGEKAEDPVFFVSDLLIHLSHELQEKKASKVVEGEALDLIIGNRPLLFGKKEDKKGDQEENPAKESVKKGILDILQKTYGVEEEDFLSAELEIVPAGRAREAGLDRSMILSYGQDDRVCAFASYRALLEAGELKRTACCILVDKEEIGSVGATGMQSKFFENAVSELVNLQGDYSELTVKRCLAKSTMLSSDVSSAFDPTYASSFDKKNVAYLGGGMVFNKFTGRAGKTGSNDANAEYLGQLRKIFDEEKVNFQTAELGKVDLGGGGTIAYILALYGMNVIDSGVAVLNMHAPWEVTSKADVYETKRGYEAFLKKAE